MMDLLLKKKAWLTAGIVFLSWLGLLPATAFAQYSHIKNAFIISPSKHEIRLGPGESVIRNVYITNNLGYDAEFSVTVEDVSGSKERDEVIKYYGENMGPYSIRNYAMVGNDRIFVPSGQTKVVPVMISLPTKVKLGGLYGGVFVSAVQPKRKAGTNISTRAGSLIFLRVKGSSIEQGGVKRFNLVESRRVVWSRDPVNFQVSFENTGNVYLNPYGIIEIRNWQGELVDRLPIEPWYVFPDSSRTRLVAWNKAPQWGIMTATLILNHGYASPHGTTLSYRFVAVPFEIISYFGIAAACLALGYYIFRKFKKWHLS